MTDQHLLPAMHDPKPVQIYERPRLTPLGNLNALLANTTGSQCDGTHNPTTGSVEGLCG